MALPRARWEMLHKSVVLQILIVWVKRWCPWLEGCLWGLLTKRQLIKIKQHYHFFLIVCEHLQNFTLLSVNITCVPWTLTVLLKFIQKAGKDWATSGARALEIKKTPKDVKSCLCQTLFLDQTCALCAVLHLHCKFEMTLRRSDCFIVVWGLFSSFMEPVVALTIIKTHPDISKYTSAK